jgi:sulfoxide reductase heme-binding subunit YedZ
MRPLFSAKWLKVPVFILCLAPLARLAWRGLQQRLGANPIEFITHETGDWTLIFLVITLSISPARKLFGQPQLIRFRRMLGLFAFFYGCLHFTTYVWLDKFFDWPEMLADVAKRRFITVGFTGFALMIPLAATSTAGWVRRLGGRRWQALHRLIYVSAVAGVVHYYWLVKSDIRKPVAYGTVVALLLAWRFWRWLRAKSIRPSVSSDAPKDILQPTPPVERKHHSQVGGSRVEWKEEK